MTDTHVAMDAPDFAQHDGWGAHRVILRVNVALLVDQAVPRLAS